MATQPQALSVPRKAENMAKEQKWLSLRQCADEFGCSVDTVKRWARGGILTHWEMPKCKMKIDRASWERFLAANTKKGVA